ncbi:hypothetical protein ACTFIU_003658 [Dictyostelium citrinum]
MKMKYPEYNYQKDPWSKINKFFDSINIIKKDKNKNKKNVNKNGNNENNNNNKNNNNNNYNNNNNKTVLTEFCSNNCKINNSNNNNNSFHSFNDNYQQQQIIMGNIDIIKDSPNSQKHYLDLPSRQDDRVDYWFKQPEDWEINLKILYQLKWRKQMTPCFKRYKIKTREKITYDHFKV